MQKGLFSSPAAALELTSRRIALLSGKEGIGPDELVEVSGLETFRDVLDKLAADPDASSFSKYQRLLTYLRSPDFAWTGKDAQDRLVIFSERIETLRWLARALDEGPQAQFGSGRNSRWRHGGHGTAGDCRTIRQKRGPDSRAAMLGRRQRGSEPPLLLPSDRAFRPALVADGIPATQRTRGPIRSETSTSDRLPLHGSRHR